MSNLYSMENREEIEKFIIQGAVHTGDTGSYSYVNLMEIIPKQFMEDGIFLKKLLDECYLSSSRDYHRGDFPAIFKALIENQRKLESF